MPQSVRKVAIEEEMRAAYLDYAMSVIVARALPDVRDGLKPVHRRILYAMYTMGLTPDKPYRKSARIVGEVLGKYHPHGDAAVYDAMARMAQDFSLRYPLVDGQGNFGSIDGDSPAAMRYTEARLSPLGMVMLKDIEKDTVDYVPNFDGTLKEPQVLPSPLPNLLVNGASGIAVGMASNIPPHNLGEIVDALVYLIEKGKDAEEVTVEELLRFVKGPDFPTGGIVYQYDENGNDLIANTYASGRGKFYMQGTVYIEPGQRGKSNIVISEIPYQTDKTRLIERIAKLARDGKINGISDLRDESDRQGMRVVVEVARNVDAHEVLGELFRLTPLQTTFGVGMLALVDGEPRTLSLKRMLLLYLEHRKEIVTRRTKHDLAEAEARAHILEGLLRALDMLDEVIATIRRSRTTDTARKNLIKNFKFTEVQAQAILNMPLKRLAALERRMLEEEYKQKKELIRYLKKLLKSKKMLMEVIKEELLDLKSRFGDRRRTQIIQRKKGIVMAHEAAEEEESLVVIDTACSVYRIPASSRRKGQAPRIEKSIPMVAVGSNTKHTILLFTDRGRMGSVKVFRIEEEPAPLTSYLSFEADESVAAALSLSDEQAGDETMTLMLVTNQGKVKRISMADAIAGAHNIPAVIKLDESERLIGAAMVKDEDEVILFSSAGKGIRFKASEVRTMGLGAAGVRGMSLGKGEEVVSIAPIVENRDRVATVTEYGAAKWSPAESFPAQKRAGSGVIVTRVGKGERLVAGISASKEDELFAIGSKGSITYLRWDRILPKMRRDNRGRPAARLKKGEVVSRALWIEH